MLKRIFALAAKYKSFLLYAFFGIITTVVNYAVYFPLYNFTGMSGTLSNAIAWIASVLVAFLTNKPFVFKSMDWSFHVVKTEFVRFVICRLGSMIIESGIILVTVDLLGMEGNIIKLVTSVFVIIANYAASKLLVFRNKQ